MSRRSPLVAPYTPPSRRSAKVAPTPTSPLEAELSELRSRLEAVEAPIAAEVAELRARLDFVERSSDGADRVHRADASAYSSASRTRASGVNADHAGERAWPMEPARRGPPPGSRRAPHQTGPREAVVVLRDGRRIPLRRQMVPHDMPGGIMRIAYYCGAISYARIASSDVSPFEHLGEVDDGAPLKRGFCATKAHSAAWTRRRSPTGSFASNKASSPSASPSQATAFDDGAAAATAWRHSLSAGRSCDGAGPARTRSPRGRPRRRAPRADSVGLVLRAAPRGRPAGSPRRGPRTRRRRRRPGTLCKTPRARRRTPREPTTSTEPARRAARGGKHF